MTAYLDASVILPILVQEPGSAVVDRFMASDDEELVVSEFAAAEVASALSRLVRTGGLERSDAVARLADFDAWRAASTTDLELRAADARLANVFVRRFELMLRVPDALHAAACHRADLLLVTLDHRLGSGARELGVRTLVLEA